MNRTIFSKLMYLCLSMVVICVSVLGMIHFFLIQSYTSNYKTEQLSKETLKVRQYTEILIKNYSNVAMSFYQMNIDNIASNSGCYIAVADKTGKIIAQSQNIKSVMPADGTIDMTPFKETLEGKSGVKSYVRLSNGKGRMIAVSEPVLINGENGVIALFADIPLINDEAYTMLLLLLLSTAIALLVSVVLCYFLSMKLSKPIKLLSASAKEIAKGNFRKRSVKSDIAEFNELGAAFDKMAYELDKQERSRSAFIANVSHDLRTPMTTISGFVQAIIDDTVPPEKTKDYLKVVLNETNRLSGLFSAFLDAGRYDTGEIKLNISNMDINEMLRAVVLQFDAKLSEKHINLNLDIDSHSAIVRGDEQAIQRVLVNLMDNAVKFSDDGGVISVVSVHQNKSVYISIENSGAEISSEDLRYIWDRFYKTDKSRVRDKNGVGLGLYIVKNIIEHHGRQITAESGNGLTKFTFSLQSSP